MQISGAHEITGGREGGRDGEGERNTERANREIESIETGAEKKSD
jgi:hypothetical protein